MLTLFKLIAAAGTKLMEPLVSLEVVCDKSYSGNVLGDLHQRRVEIKENTIRGENVIISGLAPLAELLGYSKHLRIITSGHGSFTMEFHSYKEVIGINESKAIRNITGFDPC